MSRLCMKEISRALIEMISDYPDFIEKVQKLVPGATKDEELLCMLIAVGQSVDEIEQLFCLPAEQVYMFRKSVCWKMRLEEEKLLGDKLREILEG